MAKLRALNWFVAVCVVGFFFGSGMSQWRQSARAQVGAPQETSPELAALQQERIATLREARDMADRLFAQGVGTESEVDRLNQMLLDAELAAATSKDERMSILQDELTAATKREEIASQQAKQGLATPLTTLEAKAYRLGIEIKRSEESAR